MKLELGDLVSLKSGNYLVVSKTTYDAIDYVLTNKVNKEDIGQENFVFKVNNNKFTKIKSKELLDILLPIFTQKLNKMITEEGD